MNSIGKPLNYEGPLYAPHPDLVKIKPVFGGCYNYNRLKKEGLVEEEEVIYDDYSDPFGGH